MKTLSLLLVLASTMLVSVADVDGATIAGSVTANGAAANMTVAAYSAAGALQASATTNAAGGYTLTLPAGTYRLLAYDPNGVFATTFFGDASSFETTAPLTVTASQNVTGVNFRLVTAGRIAGVASPGVTVAAYNLDGTRRAFSSAGADGAYLLTLPPGAYRVVAYDESLELATLWYRDGRSFDAATVLTVAAGSTSIADLQLARAAKVTGRVTDRTTNAPLAAMRVTAYSADGSIAGVATTGADGSFAFAAWQGALRLVIDDPAGNYATTFYADATSFEAQPALAAPAGATLNVAATLARGGRIGGKVVDRITLRPLSGIRVAAYNADGSVRALATTAADGSYLLVTPPGDFRVGAYDEALQYLPQFHGSATFSAATPIHVIAQQTVAAIDLELGRGARVTGRAFVASSSSSLPASGGAASITIAAYDVAGTFIAAATTRADGSYELLLPAGVYKLLAFDAAHQFGTTYYADASSFETTLPLALIEGQALIADFAMRPFVAPAASRRRAARH